MHRPFVSGLVSARENLQTSEGIFPIREKRDHGIGKNHEESIELRNKREKTGNSRSLLSAFFPTSRCATKKRMKKDPGAK